MIGVADARNLPLEDGTVDLVVTSPPYYAFRNYTSEGIQVDGIRTDGSVSDYLDDLDDWMREMGRVMAGDSNLFVVLGDRYAGSGGHNNAGFGSPKERGPKRYAQDKTYPAKSRMGIPWRFANRCVDRGWILRADIVWEKPVVMPTNARDRVEINHEYIFHFAKNRGHYGNGGGRSVWVIPTAKGRFHISRRQAERIGVDYNFAAFPIEIPLRAIWGWCRGGGLVLDPFVGSGTTGMAVAGMQVTQRQFRFAGFDTSSDYVKLARWRTYGDRTTRSALQAAITNKHFDLGTRRD